MSLFLLQDTSEYSTDSKLKGNKEPLDKGERRERKSCHKTKSKTKQNHGIQSHHFMANRKEKSGSSDKF